MSVFSLKSLQHPIVENLPIDLSENMQLYKAQVAANQIFSNDSFLKKDEIPANNIFNNIYNVIKKFTLVIYKINYTFQSVVIFGFSKVSVAGDYLLGWLLRPIINSIYPINPINAKRHLVLIPKAIEKFLGDILHSTLSDDYETNELIGSCSVSEKVKQVFNRLIKMNSQLINPANESVKFNYRVKTIPSSQINAFAVAGGGITVFSRIVRELHESLQKGSIRDTVITFASGSKLKIDLSKVKIDDVLAALLGHEITHAASRHTNLQLTFLVIAKIITVIGNLLFVRACQAKDDEYQRLKSKKADHLTPTEAERLKELENKYVSISDMLFWIEDKLKYFINLFKSRKNEYEADVTGIYLAHKSGYDPLGALYLEEFLKQHSFNFLHKNFEFLFTHPYCENRKLAAFAAINEIDQRTLERLSSRI